MVDPSTSLPKDNAVPRWCSSVYCDWLAAKVFFKYETGCRIFQSVTRLSKRLTSIICDHWAIIAKDRREKPDRGDQVLSTSFIIVHITTDCHLKTLSKLGDMAVRILYIFVE